MSVIQTKTASCQGMSFTVPTGVTVKTIRFPQQMPDENYKIRVDFATSNYTGYTVSNKTTSGFTMTISGATPSGFNLLVYYYNDVAVPA